MLESHKNKFLKSKGLTTSTTLKEAISDLLQSNGKIPTPDRKGFKSGIYGAEESDYQKFLRTDYAETHNIPDSHSFAKHSSEKLECFKKLLANCGVRGRRIDGDERKKWNIKQRSITILDADSISPTITGHPDDYLHYCEPRIMTVRECARIQSFPDWYEIKEKYTTGGEMRKIEVPRLLDAALNRRQIKARVCLLFGRPRSIFNAITAKKKLSECSFSGLRRNCIRINMYVLWYDSRAY